MRDRLPLILSTTALIVAVFGATPLGEAAYNAVVPTNSVGTAQIRNLSVTGAKLRGDAVDSGKVKDRSLKAIDFALGQIPAGPTGPKGDKGERGEKGGKGDTGISAYEVVGLASPTSNGYKTLSASAKCPDGKKLLGGGGYVSPSGEPAAIWASWPDTGRNQWTVSARQYAADTQTYWGLYVMAICAKVAS